MTRPIARCSKEARPLYAPEFLIFTRQDRQHQRSFVVHPVGVNQVSHLLSSFIIVLSRQLEGKDKSYENI